MGTESLLSVRGVSKKYRGSDTNVLLDIELSIERCEHVVFVGPSGCGKTTLLRIIAGLDTEYTGKVFILGKPVSGPGADRCMVFQHSALLPWLTVYENICYPRTLNRVIRNSDDNPAKSIYIRNELINITGLDGCKNLLPKELSGGMKQRVEIVRAIVSDPLILLMDEPFSALDFYNKEIMHDLVLKILNVEQKTLIFVTHDIDEAIYLADRVVVFGANPGTIYRVYDIPFGHGRSQNIKDRKEFLDIREAIYKDIRSLSKKSSRNLSELANF